VRNLNRARFCPVQAGLLHLKKLNMNAPIAKHDSCRQRQASDSSGEDPTSLFSTSAHSKLADHSLEGLPSQSNVESENGYDACTDDDREGLLQRICRITTVRLKLEQIQLVSGVEFTDVRAIGLQGA
jgi:hypothetical protein